MSRVLLIVSGLALLCLGAVIYVFTETIQFWSTFPRGEDGFAFSQQHPIRYQGMLSVAFAVAAGGVAVILKGVTRRRIEGI